MQFAVTTNPARDPAFQRFLGASETLGLRRKEQARLLGLNPDAFYRRMRAGTLREPERVLANFLPQALARVTELYGDEARARKWLTAPNHALGGQRPVDLLSNLEGYEQVINVCEEAVYGFY